MLDRIIGVIKLDVPTYEEIEHDENATMQAAIIVLAVAIIGAIGAYFAAGAASDILAGFEGMEGMEQLTDLAGSAALSPTGLAVRAFINALLSWGLWSGVTMVVGTRVFGGQATFSEMLRVLGFAQAPALISFIPCLGVLGSIWALVCGFIAIRQGLDLDNAKAAFTIILSWIATFVVSLLLAPIYAAIF